MSLVARDRTCLFFHEYLPGQAMAVLLEPAHMGSGDARHQLLCESPARRRGEEPSSLPHQRHGQSNPELRDSLLSIVYEVSRCL